MRKEDLLVEIKKAYEATEAFSKFAHLPEGDEPTETIANLNYTLRRIQLGLELSEMKEIAHPKNEALKPPIIGKKGALVRVKPCDDKYEGKTYVGYLLGELATGSSIQVSEGKLQCNWAGYNPAIFVPELGEVIMGYASWWGVIKSEEDFKVISDDDIANVWYVKAWRRLQERQPQEP